MQKTPLYLVLRLLHVECELEVRDFLGNLLVQDLKLRFSPGAKWRMSLYTSPMHGP